MKRIAPTKTVKEALGWMEEKIGGLTILSVLFIFFGAVQVLGAQTTIATPSGSVNVGIGLRRIIFSAIFLASGISLWTRRLWSWALTIVATILLSVVGFYGVYLGIATGAISIVGSGVFFAVLSVIFLFYLNQARVKGEFE